MSSNSNSFKGSNNKNPGSNSMIRILLIGFAILIILYFIYSLMKGYSTYKKTSPYLINDIVDGTMSQKIKAHNINPPMDNQYGTEMSYSFWIYLNDRNFDINACPQGEEDLNFKHIFHKGSSDYSKGQHLPLLQMPGVWLYPNTNKLSIRFNTFENIVESADVGNIPLNAWVHMSVVLIGNSVDVFINGNLKKRQKLNGVPKLNYEDLYISNWGGFNGYLCKLRYFNYAVQPFMIDYLFKEGPSTEFDSRYSNGLGKTSPQLAQNYWMTVGFPNSTGPIGTSVTSSGST
jgi:hypothetical protein